MTLHQRSHYFLRCDNCGCTFGYWEGRLTSPQAIWAEAVQKYHWTSFDNDQHHCARCPPICPECGVDDCPQCGVDDCEHVVEEWPNGQG